MLQLQFVLSPWSAFSACPLAFHHISLSGARKGSCSESQGGVGKAGRVLGVPTGQVGAPWVRLPQQLVDGLPDGVHNADRN